MDKRAVIVARERELALRLFVRRLEQPASARIVCDAFNDFAYGIDRGGHRFAIDTCVRELAFDSRTRRPLPIQVPGFDAFSTDLGQHTMSNCADRRRGRMGPIELAGDRFMRSGRKTERNRCRRFGWPVADR